MKTFVAICLMAVVSGELIDEPVEGDFVDYSDPKDNYFRYVRQYDGEQLESNLGEAVGDIPKPGVLQEYYAKQIESLKRERRNAEEATTSSGDTLSLNLKLKDLDTENATEAAEKELSNEFVINDFIRFKRDAKEVRKSLAVGDDKTKIKSDIDVTRPKRDQERSGKILLGAGETMLEGNREPRGLTKDQWIKQPYPVQTTNPHPHRSFEDLPTSSESARAPRVHFVTQRRSESAPPLVYHSYERENQLSGQLTHDSDRDAERGYYSRPSRHFNAHMPPQNYPLRRDPYYTRYDRRQEYPEYSDRYYDEDRPVPSFKQKRIIYYATLPDVVRTPPNVDFRDKYQYRDHYDSRYITSPPVSVNPQDTYRFRNSNPYSKSRYDEASKAYPTKVSTDVNVREIKKNPERRIYSEADSRYAFKPNYDHGAPYDNNK